MRKIFMLLTIFVAATAQLMADKIQASDTWPDGTNRPEHVYTMTSGNNVVSNGLTAPTQTVENYGKFAFYAVENVANAYYMYSYTANKWVSYDVKESYSDGQNFVKMTDAKVEGAYFKLDCYDGTHYQLSPYKSSGEAAGTYLNWHGGVNGNPYDSNNTLGLYSKNGTDDGGSRYSFVEDIYVVRNYTISIPDGQTIKIGETVYADGQTYTIEGSVSKGDITVVAPEGKFAAVAIDDVEETITVYFATLPTQAKAETYKLPVLYPAQQDAVGEANAVAEDGVYTLSNNVLAASFMKLGNALYFAGSDAMDLVAGTEIFTVAFGSGDNVPASAMTLKGDVQLVDLKANPNAIGGAEHYAGKALVANYEYTYKDSLIAIEWRAVLRDGSHYLRTEMVLEGKNDVDMFNIIPMIYNVDTKKAGSTPEVIGNTRGAVLMSNKIFAGLETPTAYNTVGGATGEEDKWNLATTLDAVTINKEDWIQLTETEANAVKRVEEATGATYPDLFAYKQTNVTLEAGQKVETKVEFVKNSGNNRLNFGGADLLDANGNIVASDYHSGYSGNAHEKNVFSFNAPNAGTFTIRVIIQDKSEPITAQSILITQIFSPKEGVVINTDVVGIQGRWSRNTILQKGENWKVAAVVGLIAQDGKEKETDITKTQKRRSFLAYSERERAVPWRANPCYISWYELNINRNNAEPGKEPENMVADQVLDVLAHWKSDMYDRYGVGASMYIIDDGWDTYGEWKFHAGFPDEMRDIAKAAKELGGAGVGAWLGPVGGYGQSGNYRRSYWNGKGGMQLSNPAYYKAFKDAAYNLVCNQDGTDGYQKGSDNYTFFKFDGISAQFSATGPDNGDTGNENAEGIIRLERYVREELREDIFFNTTVGTWASPFWYQITDATWRQENDHGHAGDNSLNREKWITYRDNLVHQNYVINSPICPINTLMTHGFILTKFGPPAGDNRDYISARNELRCAFLCGSGMVELYNDYDLMNSINGGALWADLAECIAWQKRNADVLPDAHWVGGDPWTGAVSQVYGWASWNGKKSTLALRNGANGAQQYTFTLREALNIPGHINGSIILRSAFGEQAALEGLTEGTAINIDEELTVTLPGSSVYAFEGIDAAIAPIAVESINLATENGADSVALNRTIVVKATLNPTTATFPALVWTSSDTEVATVEGGLVLPKKLGDVTITATAKDGSNAKASITLKVTQKVLEPYATNFEKNANPVGTDRVLNGVSLKAGDRDALTIQTGVVKPYVDKSADSVFVCTPGELLTVTFDYTGGWMNGYVYIDLDGNEQFSFKDGQTDQSGTEVMSYSFYSGSFNDANSGVNSLGETITGAARNTLNCPSFSAPAEVGEYRIRFKVDWNSIDAGGQLAADGTCTGNNGFLANRGAILDATLYVLESIPSPTPGEGEDGGDEPTDPTPGEGEDGGDKPTDPDASVENIEGGKVDTEAIYDLQGRRVLKPTKGLYIIGNKKVVLR